MAIQNLRSSQAHRRAIPSLLSAGQICINTNEASPGLFFKDSNGDLVKVGPVHIGTSAPNSSPDSLGAGSLVTGTVYQILTLGTSDFTAVGASANTVGTIFTATGTTTGTGTVSTGVQGNEKGEQWLDTTGGAYDLKIYDGSAWRSQAGEFVNVTGDTMTGALGVVAGSASAPGVFFSGDTNTGLLAPAADSVAITTGGTQRIVVDSSGRVGIGTSSPGAALDVFTSTGTYFRGGSDDTARQLIISSSTTTNAGDTHTLQAGSSTGVLAFKTFNTERARIDSSGRLLVGTSSARSNFFNGFSSWTPQHQIETAGSSSVGVRSVSFTYGRANGDAPIFAFAKHRSDSIGGTTVVQSGDGVGVISFQGSDGTDFVEAANISAVVDGTPGANDMPGRLVFATSSDGAASPTERMRIDSSGRLLVGTTTEGYASADNFTVADSGNCGVTLRSGNVNLGTIAFSDATSGNGEFDGYIQYSHATAYMAFATNQDERMRIDSSGNVLIGGSTAATADIALNANGSATFAGSVQAGGNAQSGTAVGTRLNSYGAVHAARTNDSDVVWGGYKVGNSTPTSQITADGSATFASNVGIGTTSPGRILHVDSGSTSNSYVRFTNSNSVSNGAEVGLFDSGAAGPALVLNNSMSDGVVVLNTQSQERMRIDSSGNVLIGGTTAATADIALNANGSASFAGDVKYGGFGYISEGDLGTLYSGSASGSFGIIIGTEPGSTSSVERKISFSLGAGGASEVASIGSDGSASFAGSIIQQIGTEQNFRVNTSGSVFLGNPAGAGNLTGNNKFILLNGEDGSAEFAGDLTIADKIIHSGDTNTAIRFPAADTVSVETSGSEAMRIDSSGNMGLGTSSPYSASNYNSLTLNGSTGSQIRFRSNDTDKGLMYNDASSFNIYSMAGIPLVFTAGAVERMRIDSSGRMGLGTSNPLVPFALSHDGNKNLEMGYIAGGAFPSHYIQSYNRGTSAYTPLSIFSSETAFFIDSSEKMRIDSAGRVGIGNSSPDSPLHLGSSSISAGTGHYQQIETAGNILYLGIGTDNSANINANGVLKFGAGSYTTAITIDTSQRVGINNSSPVSYASDARNLVVGSGSGSNGLTIASGSSNSGTIYFADGTSGGSLYTGTITYNHASNYMAFWANENERMRIDSSGNVKIGTTSDGAGAGFATRIAVSGGDTAIFRTTGVGASSAVPIRAWHDATSGNNLLQIFHTDTSLTTRGTITYNRSSNLLQYNTTSDARLKTNITDASSALSDLGQVRVRSFDWIEDGHNRVNYGFVAQELNDIAPYAVSEGDHEDEVSVQWGVSNSSMVPLLTKALQEAIAKIETLEAKVAALEAG